MTDIIEACADRELLLHAMADGELDAANALALEKHLRECSGCGAVYADIVKQKERLKSESLRFRAPDSLRQRALAAIAAEDKAKITLVPQAVIPASAPARRLLPFPRAAATLSAMALAASLVLTVTTWNSTPGLDNQLVTAHVRSLLVSHLTDVESSDRHTVKPWFLGKLDFAPPVVDLAQQGYPLIGGRLDYLGGRVVPALVYRRSGHVINLFIWPSEKVQAGLQTFDGYHILSWTRGAFSFAAISDLETAGLREFQQLVESAVAV